MSRCYSGSSGKCKVRGYLALHGFMKIETGFLPVIIAPVHTDVSTSVSVEMLK